MVFACPTCSNPLGSLAFRHCPACGQALTPPAPLSPQPGAAATPAPPGLSVLPPLRHTPGHGPAQGHWLPRLSVGLGTASLFFLPLALVAVPVGLVSLSAIAQGKLPKSGLAQSAWGVAMGLGAYWFMGLMVRLFSLLSGL